MFQNHNSIGQNNTEQNKRRQNNNEISSSHSKTRQHRPFCSHHKSIFPTQGPPQAPPNTHPPHHTPTGLQHAPPPHRHIHTHPSCIIPLFHLPPFPKAPLPMLLANRHQQSSFKKTSMKSKLFGPLPHRHPNTCPNIPPQQDTPACTTPSQAYPPHPSCTPFLLSTFLLFPRRHFPCSWQTDINRAASKNFNEKQTLWQQTTPPHRHPNTCPPNRTLQHAPPPHRHIHPTLLAPPSSFSQGATSHALGKQTSTQPFQKV